jgi:hypothetical protein
MPKIKVYFDYFDGKLAPIWMVIRINRGEINWGKNTMYVPVQCPFDRQNPEDFDSSALGISVHDTELTVNALKPGYFGIHLPRLKKRAEEEFGYNMDDIEQLIIQVADLEEILQMSVFREEEAS